MERVDFSATGMEFQPLRNLDVGAAEQAYNGLSYAVDKDVTVIGRDALLMDHEYGLFGVFDQTDESPSVSKTASREAALVMRDYIHEYTGEAPTGGSPTERLTTHALQAMQLALEGVENLNNGSIAVSFMQFLPGGEAPNFIFGNAGACRIGSFSHISRQVGWLKNQPSGNGFELAAGMQSGAEVCSASNDSIYFLCTDGVIGQLPGGETAPEDYIEAFTQDSTTYMARKLLRLSTAPADKGLIIIKLI